MHNIVDIILRMKLHLSKVLYSGAIDFGCMHLLFKIECSAFDVKG